MKRPPPPPTDQPEDDGIEEVEEVEEALEEYEGIEEVEEDDGIEELGEEALEYEGIEEVDEDDGIEVGLPEPEVPLTQEERDERLKEIAADIQDTFPRFERHNERTLRYAIQMGRRLIEAKTIVGHGRFGKWVKDNCPFDHKTANNYMNLITNLKFETLSNLALEGMANAVESYKSQKEWAKRRREVAKERAAASFASNPKRRSRFGSFRDKRVFKLNQHKAAQKARSEEYLANNLLDLTKLWRRPHKDCQWIEVEWRLPDDGIRGVYVWLPEYAHAEAHSVIAGATHGHWKGGAALRYHYLVYGGSKVERDHGREESGAMPRPLDGVTWDQVQAKLSELSKEATAVRRAEAMAGDPATIRILENWRDQGRVRH